ncbi:MAG: aldo/keto reductase [Spirochaetaceae bacterium]|nr:aldo/keto reductase [Spirochaetaceae bacterium]MCF7947590.1 aldo/keto reductase [Spirochaetia bacterium]MCF7951458.1 aldo/keto reductase [Spirochaetaceae bacterium]
MKTTTLGRAGLGSSEISTVALGTWTFAGDAIWGESREQQCIRVVHAALDHGINLFDTAPNYGNGRSEEILGKALADRPEALVASKCKVEEQSPGELRKMVTDTLRRLQRDTIDLMQIHWPAHSPQQTRRALEIFSTMQQEGLIRTIGVCNFGVYDIKEENDFPIVSNQIPYNLLWRVIENEIAEESRKNGIITIAYTALQQGLLSGKYKQLSEFPSGRKRTRHFSPSWPGVRHSEPGMEAQTQAALEQLLAIGKSQGKSLLELALAFVGSKPFIDTMLIGARTEEQLTSSIQAAETTLSADVLQALEDATEELKKATGGNPDMYQSNSRVRYTGSDNTPRR